MNKSLFTLKEYILPLLLIIFIILFAYWVVDYFDIIPWSNRGLSVLFIPILTYTFFYIQTIWRLIQLGVDFGLPENQNGHLVLQIDVLLTKEQIRESLRKRKTSYEIISRYNNTFTIQHSSNAIITLQILDDGQVTLRAKNDDDSWFRFGHQYFWRSQTDHFFHFHRLIKDEEIAFVRNKSKNIALH